MSAEPVLRPEFDLYMKIQAKASTQTASAITKLTEYTIHNDHKHEETEKRLTNQAKTIIKIKDAVEANTKVTQIAKPVKWAIALILTGALIAYGTNLTNNYFSKHQKTEKVKAK